MRGVVRFWEGWCGARGLLFFCNGCGNGKGWCNGRSELLPYEKWVWWCGLGRVGVERGDYCPFATVVGMARVGATGGASSSPTKSGWDSAIWEGLVWSEGAWLFISFSIIVYVFTKCKIHSVSPYRSIHVLTASMPNKRSFRSYSRHLLYQSCKGAVYSSFQTQASVCRTAV